MEKILFKADGENPVEFYVLEQTTVSGINYILVTEEEDGDSEALMLKDTSKPEDEDAVYEIVSDDTELKALADIFESLMEDISFE